MGDEVNDGVDDEMNDEMSVEENGLGQLNDGLDSHLKNNKL